jgi:hypothetical protein
MSRSLVSRIVHSLPVQGAVGGAAPDLIIIPINALEASEDGMCCLSARACFVRDVLFCFLGEMIVGLWRLFQAV